MTLRTRFMKGLAGQLGHPRGPLGRVVAARLNRRNRSKVTAAIDALGELDAAAVADLGFGGGVGLEVLLERVGTAGHVHGVELSQTMLSRAQRRFRNEVSEGRLYLHAGTLARLPLADDSLEAAITVNTIYFLPELDAAFAELARCLKSSGRAVVGIADPDMMTKLPFTEYGFHIRPVAEVVATLSRAGLALLEDRRAGEGDEAGHLLVVTPA